MDSSARGSAAAELTSLLDSRHELRPIIRVLIGVFPRLHALKVNATQPRKYQCHRYEELSALELG